MTRMLILSTHTLNNIYAVVAFSISALVQDGGVNGIYNYVAQFVRDAIDSVFCSDVASCDSTGRN